MLLDYGHPWNTGDTLHFGADTNPWHSNGHVADRLGEFLLYNEYDPRRAILFQANGTPWSCLATIHGGHICTDTGGPAPTTRQFFLNWDANEGPVDQRLRPDVAERQHLPRDRVREQRRQRRDLR